MRVALDAQLIAAGESYLPEGMPEPGFYQPVERGLEIKIAQKLAELRGRNAAAASAPGPEKVSDRGGGCQAGHADSA